MTGQLTGFIIRTDMRAQILNIYWRQPVYLISPFQKTIIDLFAEKDQTLIEEMLQQAYSEKEALFCQRALTIRSPQVKLSVCLMATGSSVLMIGLDLINLGVEHAAPAIREVIHHLLHLVRNSENELIDESDKIARAQFEQIQKLNNELLNTQRQLTKANAKLNQLNSDLNNRLVKDELTGLVSRYQYRTEIEMLISMQPDKLGIFTFIDIDRFKLINDTHGHHMGDQYLKVFAKRLKSISFNKLICMRISGDEFGLYIHGYETVSSDDIANIWQAIHDKVIHPPIDIDGLQLDIFCSAGMAIYGKDTTEIYDLIEYADFAMYEAKNSGRNTFKQFSRSRYENKSK